MVITTKKNKKHQGGNKVTVSNMIRKLFIVDNYFFVYRFFDETFTDSAKINIS